MCLGESEVRYRRRETANDSCQRSSVPNDDPFGTLLEARRK